MERERLPRVSKDRDNLLLDEWPRLPDDLVKTADDIYIRFHGTKRWYRHDYSQEELEVWADRIRESAAKRVWIYFNNDRDGYALKNAKQLMRQLKDRPTSLLIA